MREITIDERDWESPQELMEWLKVELSFPDYFGGNLPALYDCLGDVCEPTSVTIVRRDLTPDTWFDKATLAFVRTAVENDNLKVRIR